MGQICHAHCPPDGGGHVLAAVLVAAGTAAGSAVAAVIGDILLAVGVVVIVLVVVLAWLLVHVLRRDRGTVTSREAIAALAVAHRRALPRVPNVITGAYVITDVRKVPEPAR